MPSNFLKFIPGPLLEDLKKNKWLPIIGAGFSLNANIPAEKKMLAWNDLGRALHADLPDHEYNNALDSISAYAHAFSRTRLVERLYDLLLIDEAAPGEAHRAFCRVPFDVVITTNFDFLLEKQYENLKRPCTPVVSEDQLSINIGNMFDKLAPRTSLIKLHGDLNHPSMLVVTEEDYENFIERRPLICTHLGDLLIKRTAVLIGYSLDDSDLRQLWRIISDRLGSLRRPAYALMVDVDPATAARYERRGIRIINLPGTKTDYDNILAGLFDDIHEAWVEPSNTKISTISISNAQSNKIASVGRSCFISSPPSFRESLIMGDLILPEVYRAGFEPVSLQDVITPGANISASVESLIARSSIAIIVIANENSVWEARIADMRLGRERVFLIQDEQSSISVGLEHNFLTNDPGDWEAGGRLIGKLRDWLRDQAKQIPTDLLGNPQKLFDFKMYGASIIASVASIETLLRRSLAGVDYLIDRHAPLLRMAAEAISKELITRDEFEALREVASARNLAAHGQKEATRKEAANAIGWLKAYIAKQR